MSKLQEGFQNGEEVPVTARMSERLITDADMLGGTNFRLSGAATDISYGVLDRYKCVADVGCDHGYVSIYLVQKGIAQTAIAMDVRKGPLSAAEANIAGYGLQEKVRVRLSDGLGELEAGEADALVIAGMGGKLMISILEKRELSALGIKTAVLQPQSDIPEFRQYLRDKGYLIEDEKIVLEDGKYYFPMRVKIGSSEQKDAEESYIRLSDESMSVVKQSCYIEAVSQLFSGEAMEDVLRICNRYGEHNILRRDPLLKAYLEHGLEVADSILTALGSGNHSGRIREIKQEISDIKLVLTLF